MTPDDLNGLEMLSHRLGHIAAMASILGDAEHQNPMIGEALFGIESSLRDVSEKMDAITDAHRPAATKP